MEHIVSEKRVITLSGESGMGKSTFVKFAAFYLFERHAFDEFIIYLDFKGKSDSSSILDEVMKYLELPDFSEQDFFTYIADKNVLLILDSLDTMIKQSEIALRNTI
jgi:predicted NACHT family NTPase